ncbi:MAG TPA: hypothetical protein PKH90_13065 [Candidatus Desulfobacillus denitrificans]|jgi:hypothetical protein|nr:hypothetical protein [Candidatus Desulfobacillus denitrificans]
MSDVKIMAAVRRKEARLFRLVALVPYTRRDGSETELAVWEGACVVCGLPFSVSTPKPNLSGRVISKSFERTRCDLHKRPPKRRGV